MLYPKQLADVNAFVDVKIPSPKDFYQRFGFRPQGGFLPNDLPFAESSTVIADCVQSQKYVESLRSQQETANEQSE